MSSLPQESVYLSKDKQTYTRVKRKTSPAFLASALAFVVLILGILPMTFLEKEVQGQPTTASALELRILCQKDLGTQMGSPDSWGDALGDLPASDKTDRYLNGREAFGSGAWFVSYNGEGEGDGLTVAAPPDRAEGKLSEDVMTKASEIRSGGECASGFAMNGVANGFLGVAKIITSVTSNFATFAFSSNIVCPTPGNPEGYQCFDLLKVIGGESKDNYDVNKNEGLIGSLTNGIYLPLLSLVVAFAGISIAYQGIVQRKLREAMNSAIWVFLAVIFGLIFLLRPALLASAPANISNTLSACVISAFSGDSCLSDPQPIDDEVVDICYTNANNVSVNEKMELISSGLTCNIWKAFILEPYSQGSFGQSFESLNTVSPNGQGALSSNVREIFEEDQGSTGVAPEKFCVNTRAVGSLDNMGGTLNLQRGTTSNSICNIALYQLYLKTDALMEGDSVDSFDSEGSNIDRRWYTMVQAAGSSDNVWSNWADGSGYVNKILVGMIAILAATGGGIVIMLVAIFAVMYYVSSIFLMAFAPLFFLIGVHPGRGRDILKGYGELVLANVFKYIASALFLIVTLALYGGVLGSSNSLGSTLLFVIIVTIALLLYRKEIIELMGRVDMGGKQLSNKFSEFGKDTAKFGAITAGGAVGGALASGGMRPDQWKDGLQGAFKGMKETSKRELQAGRIPVGGDLTKAMVRGTVRANEQVKGQQAAEFDQKVRAAKAETDDLGKGLKEGVEEVDNAVEDHNKAVLAVSKLEQDIEALRGKLDASSLDKTLQRMADGSQEGADFVMATRYNKDIKDLDVAEKSARLSGDMGRVAQLAAEKKDLTGRRDDIVSSLRQSGHLEGLAGEYNQAAAEYNGYKKQYDGLVDEHAAAKELVIEKAAIVEDKRYDAADISQRQEIAGARFEALEKEQQKQSDNRMTGKDFKRADKNAKAAAADITGRAQDNADVIYRNTEGMVQGPQNSYSRDSYKSMEQVNKPDNEESLFGQEDGLPTANTGAGPQLTLPDLDRPPARNPQRPPARQDPPRVEPPEKPRPTSGYSDDDDSLF